MSTAAGVATTNQKEDDKEGGRIERCRLDFGGAAFLRSSSSSSFGFGRVHARVLRAVDDDDDWGTLIEDFLNQRTFLLESRVEAARWESLWAPVDKPVGVVDRILRKQAQVVREQYSDSQQIVQNLWQLTERRLTLYRKELEDLRADESADVGDEDRQNTILELETKQKLWALLKADLEMVI